MQFIEHAIIACAGMGSRLGKGIPKCLAEVGGKKILEYQLEILKDIPNIRIIVGYCEDEVIKFAKSIRKDIIFVRNPSFKSTTTLQSFYLAVKGLNQNCLIMDGDIVFKQDDFNQFVKYCEDGIQTIGISTQISEEPVYVEIQEDCDVLKARGFSRDHVTSYEWANIAYISPQIIMNKSTHVYQQLANYLPIRAFVLDRLEVDDNKDLEIANSKLKNDVNYVRF